jgi:hypothetical protein
MAELRETLTEHPPDEYLHRARALIVGDMNEAFRLYRHYASPHYVGDKWLDDIGNAVNASRVLPGLIFTCVGALTLDIPQSNPRWPGRPVYHGQRTSKAVRHFLETMPSSGYRPIPI